MKPIFFAWTRSFWLAAATVALILEGGEPVIRAGATLACAAISCDVEAVTSFVVTVAPLVTLLLAMHQRSGAARPYTVDPRATT